MDRPYPEGETRGAVLGRPAFSSPGIFFTETGHCIDDLVYADVVLLLRALDSPPARPEVEQDDRDREARRMLADYYAQHWQHARELQDPTWWLARAPDIEESE